jgi:hypothetical protein
MIAEHRFPLVSVPGRASVWARCHKLSFSRQSEIVYRPTEQNLRFFYVGAAHAWACPQYRTIVIGLALRCANGTALNGGTPAGWVF